MWERNTDDQLPLKCASNWDQTHNLGMCPDWESNQQPTLRFEDKAPTNWVTQAREVSFLYFFEPNKKSLTLSTLSSYAFLKDYDLNILIFKNIFIYLF